MKTVAYGVDEPHGKFHEMNVERREVGDDDVLIDIEYCGICHSDIHTANNEWGGAMYPVVPGHEIVGTVRQTGKNVTDHRVGDRVGVGCMVDSCRNCEECRKGNEHYCENTVFTYNSHDSHTGGVTYGGYSGQVVVDRNFVLKIPENLDLAATAPLLCAGITTYSPLRFWNVKKGDRVAVAGLGGLGHMGVKLASAMGADVTVLTTSPSKVDEAKRLGAQGVILSGNKDELKKHRGEFDFILDTIPAVHDLNLYLSLLKPEGALVLVGLPERGNSYNVYAGALVGGRKTLAGSNIGGIRETQEMLDFCGKHDITADIEMIGPEEINRAYERVVKSDVKYRFVIDMKGRNN
ncbi:MAG: NAD(P)-dependent alcohol dehydrogenase [Candidatus Thermoplasmatota archaeon]|jgi:uncharacterized zinc-type alcohol dehydrogenase-like protein|nr:NAD(P)-dependent alcohol dehydrogenase [Candidatus Thermoplasmatota archaeon]